MGAMNFSGFDRSTWHPRDITTHRENVKKIQQCSTKTARAIEESRLGCRYSVLLKLPYFNPIRMLVIDPMHNRPFPARGKYAQNSISGRSNYFRYVLG